MVFQNWWKEQFMNRPKGGGEKKLVREAHMKELRAAFVTSLSEDLENRVVSLMQDIPRLRDMVSNDNSHEIFVIEQIILTRKNRNDNFCIELVHEVLESNLLILNGRYFSDWVSQVSLLFMNPTLAS